MRKEKNQQQQHQKVYYDLNNHLAYSAAVPEIAKAAKSESIDATKRWLETQPTYTLHKPVKRKFPTRSYRTSGIDHQWQADLVDMQAHKTSNRGYAYILTAIDIFSRYAFAEPIKTKRDVKQGFENIFARGGRKPMMLQTDQGTEFENKQIREFYKIHSIKQFSVKSPYKAAIVERFHRTLRSRMFRYFTKNGTRKWYDVLQFFINAYNSTKHSSLNKQTPKSITKDNEMELWASRNKDVKTSTKPTFKIGELVRLAKVKKTFDHGYTPNWTEELFKINDVDIRQRPVMYVISDLEGEVLEGKFYAPELQKVANVFRIEKILKTRKSAREMKHLVKWLGYDKPSWISAKDLV